MGINMDIRSTLDYEFMNLDNLDENVASEIRTILKTDIASDVLKLPWDNGDKDYNSNSVVPEMQPEVQNHWQPYDESTPTYEVTGTPTSLLTPPMSGMAFTPGPMIQVPYPDWQMSAAYPNTATADPNAYTYVSSVAYPSAIYQPAPTTELLSTQSPSRDDRRSGRSRNRKSDNYNRIITTNDIQPSYMMQQGQFNQIQAICHSGVQYLPYVSSQQHPAAGRPIFVPSHPSQYAPAPPLHHNNPPQPQYPHPLPSNYSQHQNSPTIKQHQRQNPQTYNPIYNQDKTQGQLQKNDKKIYESQRTTATQSFRQVNHNKSTNNNHHHHHHHHHHLNNNNYNDKISKERELKKNSRIQLTVNTNDKTNGLVNGEKSNDNISPKVDDETPTSPEINNDDDNNDDGKISEDKESVKTEEETIVTLKPIETTEETIAKTNCDENHKDDKSKSEIIKIEDEVLMKRDPVTNISALPAPKTFASILRNTSGTGNPPGFIQNQSAFKLPSARRSNVTDNVNIVTEGRGLKHENKIDDGKRGSVGPANAEEQKLGTVVEGPFVERKPLPVDHVQTPLNHPLMYRMGEFLLNYQMDKQTVSLLPRGLTNRSNYCYINSILQALLACPPFYNLLRALPYPRHPPKNSSTPLIDNMVKFVNEFMPLPEGERLQRKDRGQKKNDDTFDIKGGNAFEPSYVYTMLKNTSSPGVFSIEGRQEDAEEFLSCLLNGISDEMLELMKQVSENSENSKPAEDLNASCGSGDEEWKVMGPKNKGSITRCTEFGRTPLSDIFRGQLRSRISRQGDQSTDNVQPFFTLQLDIEKAESVKAALEILVGKDQVEGMTCSKTKQQIQAWKQVTLEELPVILILHLKWFDYKLDGCSKIFKNVAYAIDLKVDPKFLSPNAVKKLTAKQKQYKLFAVTYHDGKEATKGHYVTDAFHVGFGAWVRYDDSSVKGISENDVLNPSPPRVPYLLYYRRCDTIGNQPNTTRTR